MKARHREDRVRGGEADQEDEVQERPDEDVRLAATESTDGVVADRSHRRLDEDGDGDARHLDHAEGRVLDARIGHQDP